MEIERLAGLPAHPLFVHVPIVLIPLAAVAAVVLAVFPRHISRWGWWIVGVSGIGTLGAILAAGSGEALEESVRESEAVERHAELGEMARNVSIVLFVVLVALVMAQKFVRVNRVRTVAASVVVAVVSVAGIVTVVNAGHTGAESVWEDRISEGGERDEGVSNGQVEQESDED